MLIKIFKFSPAPPRLLMVSDEQTGPILCPELTGPRSLHIEHGLLQRVKGNKRSSLVRDSQVMKAVDMSQAVVGISSHENAHHNTFF